MCLSSGISGTYNALRMLFENESKVKVIDSQTAVGGMKILVHEINKYRNESLDFIEEKINNYVTTRMLHNYLFLVFKRSMQTSVTCDADRSI